MKRILHLETKSLTFHMVSVILISFHAALIYSNTFSVPFHFDDISSILGNPRIRDMRNFLDFSGSRYVGFLSFALNYSVGESHVFGYHLINFVIHITNAFLVYMLIILTFRIPFMASSEFFIQGHIRWIALTVAILFLSHPVQTEAVTYIFQRLASLTTVFYLLTVICYLKWRLAPSAARGRLLWYLFAILSAILAMNTKEISFTLPFMILFMEALLFSTSTKKRWVPLIHFLSTLPIIPLSRIDAVVESDVGGGQRGQWKGQALPSM